MEVLYLGYLVVNSCSMNLVEGACSWFTLDAVIMRGCQTSPLSSTFWASAALT